MKIKRRKIVLINPYVQLRIILFFSLTFAVSQLILFYSIDYFFNDLKRIGAEAGLSADHIFFRFLSDQHNDLNVILLTVGLCLLVIFIVGGYELSRRIVGPMFRLTEDLAKINKDQTLEVKFRKGDNFHEVAQAINDMIKRLK